MAQDEKENGSRSSQCAVCQIAADKKCTGCNEIVYCGKEHQKKHWSIHKKDCKCWKVIEDPNGIKGRYDIFMQSAFLLMYRVLKNVFLSLLLL